MNEQALISQLKTEMTSKWPLFMQIQQCAAPGGGNNRKSYINLENTHDMAATTKNNKQQQTAKNIKNRKS